jgi:hypothetical protein
MYVDAVEAWVTTSARRKPRPGSVAMKGGANVTIQDGAAPSARICSQLSSWIVAQTAR